MGCFHGWNGISGEHTCGGRNKEDRAPGDLRDPIALPEVAPLHEGIVLRQLSTAATGAEGRRQHGHDHPGPDGARPSRHLVPGKRYLRGSDVEFSGSVEGAALRPRPDPMTTKARRTGSPTTPAMSQIPGMSSWLTGIREVATICHRFPPGYAEDFPKRDHQLQNFVPAPSVRGSERKSAEDPGDPANDEGTRLLPHRKSISAHRPRRTRLPPHPLYCG